MKRFDTNQRLEVKRLSLRLKIGNCEDRVDAVIALGRYGAATGYSRAAKPLIQALHDSDPKVRERAAQALGSMGANYGLPIAIKPLLKALHAPSPGVRREAAWSIGGLDTGYQGARQAKSDLIRALEDTEPEVRAAAARALGWYRDPSVIPLLLDLLAKDSVAVQGAAALALGCIDDERSREALLGAVTVVPDLAAQGLGHLRERRAVEPLVLLLQHDREEVRAAAATALGQISDNRAADMLLALLDDLSPLVRKGALGAFVSIVEPRVVPYAVDALGNPDWKVDDHAIDALGNSCNSNALAPLDSILKEGNPNRSSRAKRALARLRQSIERDEQAGKLMDERGAEGSDNPLENMECID